MIFDVFSNNFGLRHVGFPEVLGGPGGFRKVREAGRTNFMQISSKTDLMVPSYDQTTKKSRVKKQRLFQCERETPKTNYGSE